MMSFMAKLACGGVMAGVLFGARGASAQEGQPGDVQTTPPVPMEIKVKAPAVPAGEITTAEALLEALERADASLRTLEADVVYDKTFDIGGDRQIRRGRLYYSDNKGEGKARARKFAVYFNQLIVGRRLEKEPKVYIFDGQWLVEKLPTQKQFIKRQIVGEGQEFDPLKIGEGPMPIPIGQRKDETLARFNAELLGPEVGLPEPEEGEEVAAKALREHVAGTMQLRLTPRSGSEEARDFLEVRLWYRRVEGAEAASASFLPVMARTVSKAEDVSLVRLTNVTMNMAMDESLLDTTPPGAGWNVDIRTQPRQSAPKEK